MEVAVQLFNEAYELLGNSLFIISGFMLFIGVVASWRIFAKAKKAEIACLVPIWNLVVFLQVVGRPSWQVIYFFIPVFNIFFAIKVIIEICNCFGQGYMVDYVFAILVTGLYMLNLALDNEIKYLGAEYAHVSGDEAKKLVRSKNSAQLA
jgi:signal peptidase I